MPVKIIPESNDQVENILSNNILEVKIPRKLSLSQTDVRFDQLVLPSNDSDEMIFDS